MDDGSLTPNNNHIRPVPFAGGSVFSFADISPLPREAMFDTFPKAAHLPYKGVWNPEAQRFEMDNPDFAGKTMFEVIALRYAYRAAEGDQKAMDGFLDRVLGKPKQSVESVNTNISLTDYLKQLAEDEKKYDAEMAARQQQQASAVDTTASPLPQPVSRFTYSWEDDV